MNSNAVFILNKESVMKVRYTNQYQKVCNKFKLIHTKGESYTPPIKKKHWWSKKPKPVVSSYPENIYAYITCLENDTIGLTYRDAESYESDLKKKLDGSNYEIGPDKRVYYKPYAQVYFDTTHYENIFFSSQEELDEFLDNFSNEPYIIAQ